ncbi:3'-5' exonuclease [Priestia megaterium]|uniref:3'-5' exonuclease n=1 Tax=Priestia megaterium TaxID=1404 RepID=UPI002ACDAA19|nr:BRCT domain-containing protein [Priestia megaterium]
MLEKMLLVDIETGDFDVDSGIYEVAVLVVENGNIVETGHIAEVVDENSIHLGMGSGYKNIAMDESKRKQFQQLVQTYPYPIVGHNVSFDRKFLVHYEWLDEDYQCFDSVRAIKYANPHLFRYTLSYLLSYYNIERPFTHVALDDVMALYDVLMLVKPSRWLPLYHVAPSKFKRFVETTAHIEGESSVFQGKRMVFTGASPFPRVLMKEIAQKCGAIVTGTVSPKTDILICGEKPGSKLAKAKELGTEVQTDEWFIDSVSKDIQLETASVTRNTTRVRTDIPEEKPSIHIPSLEGKVVNIALLPVRIQTKVEDILVNEVNVARINKGTNSINVDVIIFNDDGDYVLVKKAANSNVETIPLSKFNQMVVNGFSNTKTVK